MGVLDSTIDPRGKPYLDARAGMLAALAELAAALEAALEGGGEKAVTRHHARGKLLARERVELLVDRDSPLLELSPLAGWGTDAPVGSAMVTAIGVVEDRACVIAASDPTVRGGAVSTGTLRKIQRAQQIAYENRLPMVCLLEATVIESAERSEIFRHTGRVAAGFAQLAAAGLPTIGAFLGGSTVVGGADLAGAFDYLVMLRPTIATTRRVDHVADDERDALRLTRQCVQRCQATGNAGAQPLPAASPKFDPEDLLAVPVTEPREILCRLLDGSVFDEDQPGYGAAVCTGWGTLHGHRVAVLANAEGTAGTAESDKTVRFVRRAEQTGTPILLLRHGRELPGPAESTVAGAAVPLLTLRVGSWYGLSAVADRARFRFAWPGAGAGLVPPAAPAGPGRGDVPATGDVQESALHLSGRLDDDGVIDPRDARSVLGFCLSICWRAS